MKGVGSILKRVKIFEDGVEIERGAQRCHGFAASKFLRGAIEVCAEYTRNVRGMRPAPGTERAAYCEEGCWEGTSLCLTVNWLSKIS